MKRRAFALSLSALAAAAAFPARAQRPGRVYRIGALVAGGRDLMQQYRAALVAQLATHGFVEGRNLEVDTRGATGYFHEDRDVAREFVAAKRDAHLRLRDGAHQAATKAIPIVFAWVAEPIAS